MAVATFDTLKFANTLKAAGVPPEQAEAQARAFAEVVQLNFKDLATKDDIAALRAELDRAVKELKAEIDRGSKELRSEIGAARVELDHTAKELRPEMERIAKAAKADLEQTAKDIRRELEQAVEKLERKITEESQKVNARLDTFQAKHAGDMALMKWMLGLIVTGIVGILIRLFFFRAM